MRRLVSPSTNVRRVVFCVVVVCVFGTVAFGQYCSASGGCGGEYIKDVQVGDIDNTGTGCDGYADYTLLSAGMEIGTGYPITVLNGDGWVWQETCGIWVDWNQDEDFDDSGEDITVNGGPVTFTATITPPADANLGDTRMRIRIRHSGDPEPCGETGYGEVEDYTINVATPPTFKISGHIKLRDGSPLSGVLVTSSPGGVTDISDVNGYYEIVLTGPWTGHLDRYKEGWAFTEGRYYIDVTTDQTENMVAYWPYSGGFGISGAPYLIATAEDMNAIGAHPEDWDKHFKMIADIDLSSYTEDSFSIIGTSSEPFLGVFDGNDHKIYNFTYESQDSGPVGVFGIVGQEEMFPLPDGDPVEDLQAEIKNIGLISPTVSGHYGGTLVAYFERGFFSNCYAIDVNVSMSGSAGGLIGSRYDGPMNDCYATGTVSGGNYTGGLAGSTYGTNSRCYAVCEVAGDNKCGGLVGHGTASSFYECYADCVVSGNEDVGGLVGSSGWGSAENCYAVGAVSGTNRTGGLMGDIYENPVYRCYAACMVTGVSSKGGLIGRRTDSSVSGSFWDKDASGLTGSAGGSGRTTEQMQTMSTFTNAGWDFVGESTNGTDDIWDICEGTNYPKLAWQIPPLGDFVCPDGIEMKDFAVLAKQWLLEKLSADISPDGGDGFVDFLDWAVFANAWQSTSEPMSANWNPKCDIAPEGGNGVVDMYDLAAFVDQWLQRGAYCADIAPAPDGDSIVNLLDFAAFTENWLAGVLN